MTSPAGLEKEAQTSEDREQTGPTPVPVRKGTDRRKLAAAGVLLAASVALILFQGPRLIGESLDRARGLGGAFKLEDSLQRAPESVDDLAKKEKAIDETSRSNLVDQPASDSRSRGVLEAPAAPSVDGEMGKDKVAGGSLPPLGMTAPPVFPDPGHGYNAPGYLIKQASLQLEVGDIQNSFGKISALTEKYHGYLIDSSLSNYENSQPGAQMHLKLPSAKLSQALADLDALGTVRNKQIKTEDIWLQVKRQQLEVEHLQIQAGATKPGSSKREQQYQIKLEQLERQRLEQMLTMATVDLNLTQKAPFWDLRPLGEELRYKSLASLQATTRLLADVMLFVPPLLIFGLLAWLGWKLVRHVLITRLALMNERSLGGIYLLGLVFFPLYAFGPQSLGAGLIFALLLAAIWSGKTLYHWAMARIAAKAQPAPELPQS